MQGTTDQPEKSATSDDHAMDDVYDLGLERVMSRTEKRYIEDALKKADNSKMKAADLLKVSFRSLRYKIQKYKL